MSPSLKHHLILEHDPAATFEKHHMATCKQWTLPNGFVFFLCVSDGGDDGQGAGQSSDGDGHSADDSDSGKCRVLIHYFNEFT